MANRPVTVAYGDGIGPEIMDATLHILREAGARIDTEVIDVGEQVYLQGHTSGIAPQAWESLRRTKVFLKAPITTPQGGGYKSLNVTARKMLGLYANVRPAVSYAPYVATKHPKQDLVIVRENEEDTYAGIEHQQTFDVVQCLKLISRPGCEKIVRYAFEYARRHNRKKVTCFTKDNIMKATDGLFHRVFDEIAPEYPDIENEHWIVDIGAAKMADTPELFDVLVMPNLYGDILSDVAAQIAGSVGLAGSANIGESAAMFEAIHGSAPRRAGQNLANPSGLLHGAILMLVHIDQPDIAERVHNAWLRTIEEGIHTYDIYKEDVSRQKVGTKEFAQAVVVRLGQRPEKLKAVAYSSAPQAELRPYVYQRPLPKRELVGQDLFVFQLPGTSDDVAARLVPAAGQHGLELVMISNRGVKVWPDPLPETKYVDVWRCRFQKPDKGAVSLRQMLDLQQTLIASGVEIVKMEGLYTFDGEIGFSLGQGQ